MHKLVLWGGTKRWPFILGYTMIDDEHAIELSQYTYRLTSNGHAMRSNKTHNVYLTQDIARLMNWVVPAGMCIDHIDRDKLNNQSSNLRIATKSEDMANVGPWSHNTSGYHGVCRCSNSHKWRAFIKVAGKQIRFGRFDDPRDAAQAVNDAYARFYPTVKAPNDLVTSHPDSPR